MKEDSILWRILWMILFGFIYALADFAIILIAVIQLIVFLSTGERNERLSEFSESLANYLRDILRFVMFNTDDKPFPFASWPRIHHSL